MIYNRQIRQKYYADLPVIDQRRSGRLTQCQLKRIYPKYVIAYWIL